MHAWVVSGEGARGAFQAGVIAKLAKDEPKPDYVIGVSSGAVNAAGLSLMGPDGLTDMWMNVRRITDVFGVNYLSWLWRDGLLNTNPAEAILNKAKDDDQKWCEATVARLHIKEGTVEFVSSHTRNFHEAAIHACTIPGLVATRGIFCDAGPRTLAPLRNPIQAGADRITVILGRPIGVPIFEPKGVLRLFGHKIFTIPSVAFRFVDLMLYEILMRDLELCFERNELFRTGSPIWKHVSVRIIMPKRTLSDSLDFDHSEEYVIEGEAGEWDEMDLQQAYPAIKMEK